MTRCLLMLVLTACGRVEYQSVLDGAPSDGAEGTCLTWTAATTFSPPERVAELASPDMEQQPRLTTNGRRIYFSVYRTIFEIWTADRPDRFSPFGERRPLAEVNEVVTAVSFAPADDDLTAYVSAAPHGTADYDLHVLVRDRDTDPWGPPALLQPPSTDGADYDPFISPDQLRLYWDLVDGPGGFGFGDLVVGERSSPTGSFGAPVYLPGINEVSNDDNPSFSLDERRIVFGSNRGGQGDLYTATRADLGAPFSPPVPVPGVNDPVAYDSEAFLTPDGCEIWFVSDRAEPGNPDIYRARVVP